MMKILTILIVAAMLSIGCTSQNPKYADFKHPNCNEGTDVQWRGKQPSGGFSLAEWNLWCSGGDGASSP